MEAGTDIRSDWAFSEWRRLLEAEGDAIRAGNWTLARDCQNVIGQLKPKLETLRSQLGTPTATRATATTSTHETWHAAVSELIALVRRNQSWLEHRRSALTEQISQADLSRHNLRQLQRSYAATHARSSTLLG
jgi:hypothetical protein